MLKFKAKSTSFSVFRTCKGSIIAPHPYFRDESGDKEIWCPSPLHGRSFVVGFTSNGRYVVSKGNGLSYTQHPFLHTGEFANDTWGLLLRQDAERDFVIGQEIEALGIKTNHMEYVLELEETITLTNGNSVKPILLQYDVESPYRISDAAFMTQTQICDEVSKWGRLNDRRFDRAHMIAANILIRNLRTMHDHNILHNAIHEQNYTWALELLDFELACSPTYPYTSEDDRRHVKDLFPREIIQTYVIINYIAGVLQEEVNFASVDALFADYGFQLQQFMPAVSDY